MTDHLNQNTGHDPCDAGHGGGNQGHGGGGGGDPGHGGGETKEVTIKVNKKDVVITKGDHVGLDVKQAAIAAGLPVTVEFVLTEIKNKGEPRQTIGDNDPVRIKENSKFSLVADDDDS